MNCSSLPITVYTGRKIGGGVLVDVLSLPNRFLFPVKDIDETIDYSAIYQLYSKHYARTGALLNGCRKKCTGNF